MKDSAQDLRDVDLSHPVSSPPLLQSDDETTLPRDESARVKERGEEASTLEDDRTDSSPDSVNQKSHIIESVKTKLSKLKDHLSRSSSSSAAFKNADDSHASQTTAGGVENAASEPSSQNFSAAAAAAAASENVDDKNYVFPPPHALTGQKDVDDHEANIEPGSTHRNSFLSSSPTSVSTQSDLVNNPVVGDAANAPSNKNDLKPAVSVKLE